MTNGKHLRNVQVMAPQKDRSKDGKAPDGDLLLWSGLDLLFSSFNVWTTFARESVRRGGEIRLADLGIGKGVK
jgi:hypothetical protein